MFMRKPHFESNLINKTGLFICLHIMFQISFQNSKGQKNYHNFLGVRSELLLSIYCVSSIRLKGVSNCNISATA